MCLFLKQYGDWNRHTDTLCCKHPALPAHHPRLPFANPTCYAPADNITQHNDHNAIISTPAARNSSCHPQTYQQNPTPCPVLWEASGGAWCVHANVSTASFCVFRYGTGCIQHPHLQEELVGVPQQAVGWHRHTDTLHGPSRTPPPPVSHSTCTTHLHRTPLTTELKQQAQDCTHAAGQSPFPPVHHCPLPYAVQQQG